MTALAATATTAGRTMEHLLRIGLCEALDKGALVERGLRMLLPKLPRESAGSNHPTEYIMFDPKGRRVGIIPVPIGPPSFGAHQPTLFLLRNPR